jgi:hypothetical protein
MSGLRSANRFLPIHASVLPFQLYIVFFWYNFHGGPTILTAGGEAQNFGDVEIGGTGISSGASWLFGNAR